MLSAIKVCFQSRHFHIVPFIYDNYYCSVTFDWLHENVSRLNFDNVLGFFFGMSALIRVWIFSIFFFGNRIRMNVMCAHMSVETTLICLKEKMIIFTFSVLFLENCHWFDWNWNVCPGHVLIRSFCIAKICLWFSKTTLILVEICNSHNLFYKVYPYVENISSSMKIAICWPLTQRWFEIFNVFIHISTISYFSLMLFLFKFLF